jgi:hypothetical protein
MGGFVARLRVVKVYTGFGWENLRERDHLGDPGLDGKMILRWIITKWDLRVWTGSICFRIRTVGGLV